MPSTIPTSVLLVDDQPCNLIALEAALTSADYSLIIAHSGMDVYFGECERLFRLKPNADFG